MSLGNVHFILVRPQIGENIGSVARAIKNFNIKNLRIEIQDVIGLTKKHLLLL